MILFTPGPVPLSEKVKSSLTDLSYQYSKQYSFVLQEIDTLLHSLFSTSHHIIPCIGSGTSTIELAMQWLHNKNETQLILVNGRFSERWVAMANSLNITKDVLQAQWGEYVSTEQLEAYLQTKKPHSIWITHTETSTGITCPLQEYIHIIKTLSPDTLICIDAVSSIICEEIHMSEIDCICTASQKALAGPPGIGIIFCSARAWDYIQQKKRIDPIPGLSKDIVEMYHSFKNRIPFFTPPLPIFSGLYSSLLEISQDFIGYKKALYHQNIYLKKELQLISNYNVSLHNAAGLTVIKCNNAIEIRHILESRYNIMIAPGQQYWSQSYIRIGHMIPYNQSDISSLLQAFKEMKVSGVL